MKKRFLFFLLLFSVLSCSKDEFYNPNPYLPNYVVDVRIPLSLPLYSNLQYPGNVAVVQGYGINGIIVINTGTGFLAYERTCPNHEIRNCSALDLNGIEATCSCDEYVYNLYLGIANNAPYALKQYRVIDYGSYLQIGNF